MAVNCKLHFKNKTRLGNTSQSYFQSLYSFRCGLRNESYYGESVRHLSVIIKKCSSKSAFNEEKGKPKNAAVRIQLLICNHQEFS